MTKVTYPGPNASTRMKLKRAWLDLVPEIDRCRPLGAEYRAIEAACQQLSATYLELFGEPIRPVNMLESRAGGYARGENAKDPPLR